jgi:hypothetical protein
VRRPFGLVLWRLAGLAGHEMGTKVRRFRAGLAAANECVFLNIYNNLLALLGGFGRRRIIRQWQGNFPFAGKAALEGGSWALSSPRFR